MGVPSGIVVRDTWKSPVKKQGDKLILRVANPKQQSEKSTLACAACSHTAISHALIGTGTCDGDGEECSCISFRFFPKP